MYNRQCNFLICISGPGAYVHGLFLLVWCYGLLIFIGAGCLLYFGVQQWKEHRQQKKKNTTNYTDVFIQGDLWTEWVNFKLVSWLGLFYLIMELPYIVVHQISALRSYPVDTGNATLPMTVMTPRYETAFTWFRFIYSCVFTIVVFTMRKDIRHKFKALTQWCRGGVVREHSAAPVTVKPDTKKPSKKNSLVPLSLNTPVLYISPDGLCLRQLAKKSKRSDVFTNKHQVGSQPKFVSYFCDLDNSISGEDFLVSSFSTSNSERRWSKESEVSLPQMETSMNQLSEEIPMKDMSTLLMEPQIAKPLKPKKAVRFVETLTIFRSLTPRSPTPEWVVNIKNNKELNIGKGRVSRIPVRKVDNISPWKVELNSTYRVNTPVKRLQRNNVIASDSKLVFASGQKNKKARDKPKVQSRLVRERNVSSPPRWKINKLI